VTPCSLVLGRSRSPQMYFCWQQGVEKGPSQLASCVSCLSNFFVNPGGWRNTYKTWAGIATGYGLDCPGIESRWGARFFAPVQTGPGAHPGSCTMGTESFRGVRRPGRDVDQPPLSSAEVKERVELYLYSPSGPSWPVLG